MNGWRVILGDLVTVSFLSSYFGIVRVTSSNFTTPDLVKYKYVIPPNRLPRGTGLVDSLADLFRPLRARR